MTERIPQSGHPADAGDPHIDGMLVRPYVRGPADPNPHVSGAPGPLPIPPSLSQEDTARVADPLVPDTSSEMRGRRASRPLPRWRAPALWVAAAGTATTFVLWAPPDSDQPSSAVPRPGLASPTEPEPQPPTSADASSGVPTGRASAPSASPQPIHSGLSPPDRALPLRRPRLLRPTPRASCDRGPRGLLWHACRACCTTKARRTSSRTATMTPTRNERFTNTSRRTGSPATLQVRTGRPPRPLSIPRADLPPSDVPIGWSTRELPTRLYG